MPTYRKKPVEIEARELRYDNAEEVLDWMKRNGGMGGFKPQSFYINTLEGVMTADVGDFVIKGVKGEFYPCKPDIFWMTYEEVE